MNKRLLAGTLALLNLNLILTMPAFAGEAPVTELPVNVTCPGLTRYVDMHGFYSVLLRGEAKKGAEFVLPGDIKYATVVNEDKNGSWTAAYADMPDMGTPPYDAKKLSSVINNQVKGFVEHLHGKMQVYKAEVKFGCQFRNVEGRIESGPWKDGRYRLYAYLSGRRMFVAVVSGSEAWTKSADSDAFLRSFEVPPTTAVPKLNNGPPRGTLPGGKTVLIDINESKHNPKKP